MYSVKVKRALKKIIEKDQAQKDSLEKQIEKNDKELKKELSTEEKDFFDGIKKWWESLGIQNELIIGVAIGIVVFILLIFIIKKVQDRKIDKTMDKF